MKSVVICGSKRFKSGIRKFAQELRRAGVVVMGKPIYALSDKDEELCRKVLVVDFVPTAEKLLEILR